VRAWLSAFIITVRWQLVAQTKFFMPEPVSASI
jgi:hypothetical protein